MALPRVQSCVSCVRVGPGAGGAVPAPDNCSPQGPALLGLCPLLTASTWPRVPQSNGEEGRGFCEALGSKGSMNSRVRCYIWGEERADPTLPLFLPFPFLVHPLLSIPLLLRCPYIMHPTILCPHSTCGEKPGYRLTKDSASSLTLAREAGPNLQKFDVVHSASHPRPHNLPVKAMGETAAPAPRLGWGLDVGVQPQFPRVTSPRFPAVKFGQL